MNAPTTYTTFSGTRRLVTGNMLQSMLAMKRHAARADVAEALVCFDDRTGRPVDFDLRGSEDEIRARCAALTQSQIQTHTQTPTPDATGEGTPPTDDGGAEPVKRGRGRPRLGVVAREITLLPRHWEWLSAQPGGASVVLRRLVDEARRSGVRREARRQAQARAYHFMAVMGGNLPGFEEAIRALYADNKVAFRSQTSAWPPDVREHAIGLGFPDQPEPPKEEASDRGSNG